MASLERGLLLSPVVEKLPPAYKRPAVVRARAKTGTQGFGRQLRDLERHAQRDGYQVVATIAEKLSGSRRSRAPDVAGLDELLALASTAALTPAGPVASPFPYLSCCCWRLRGAVAKRGTRRRWPHYVDDSHNK